MKKVISTALAVMAGVLTALVVALTSLECMAYSRGFYQEQYARLHQAQEIGVSESELLRITDGVIAYLRGDADSMQTTAVVKGASRDVFNAKELEHMVDVRNLFDLLRRIKAISILLVIALFALAAFLGGGRRLGMGLFWGGLGFALAAATLAAILTSDFSAGFIAFHRLFFSNDLWILDPRSDILLMMVPQPFFEAIAFRIAALCAMGLAAQCSCGWLISAFTTRKSE